MKLTYGSKFPHPLGVTWSMAKMSTNLICIFFGFLWAKTSQKSWVYLKKERENLLFQMAEYSSVSLIQELK